MGIGKGITPITLISPITLMAPIAFCILYFAF